MRRTSSPSQSFPSEFVWLLAIENFSHRLLHITSAEVRHTGAYTCRADNVAGADEKQFKVEVQGH